MVYGNNVEQCEALLRAESHGLFVVVDQNTDAREDGKDCAFKTIEDNRCFTGNWTREAIHIIIWIKQYKQQNSAHIFRTRVTISKLSD